MAGGAYEINDIAPGELACLESASAPNAPGRGGLVAFRSLGAINDWHTEAIAGVYHDRLTHLTEGAELARPFDT